MPDPETLARAKAAFILSTIEKVLRAEGLGESDFPLSIPDHGFVQFAGGRAFVEVCLEFPCEPPGLA